MYSHKSVPVSEAPRGEEEPAAWSNTILPCQYMRCRCVNRMLTILSRARKGSLGINVNRPPPNNMKIQFFSHVHIDCAVAALRIVSLCRTLFADQGEASPRKRLNRRRDFNIIVNMPHRLLPCRPRTDETGLSASGQAAGIIDGAEDCAHPAANWRDLHRRVSCFGCRMIVWAQGAMAFCRGP